MRRQPPVRLPWERRVSLLSEWIARARWSALFATLLLALVGWVIVSAARDFSRKRQSALVVRATKKAARQFLEDWQRCPRGVHELLKPARIGATPYLSDFPRDGWGRALYLRCPAPGVSDGVEVVSAGPSGSFFRMDNIQE